MTIADQSLSAAGGTAAALISRYDRPGPRYTSYPTAVQFDETFDEPAYRARLRAAAVADGPLSLYVHLPFCAEQCTYCGCTMIVGRSPDVATRYLDYLEREIALLASHLDGRRRVVQHHWGGGTPTFLTPAQLTRLHDVVAKHFDIDGAAEVAIEIDPRVTTREQLATLRSLGFNRLSMGVQDFTSEVQEAIGRRQSLELTRSLFDFARQIGFDSINLDLVYGLPRQTLATFARTLDSIIALQPDRVAVYSYAHVPWLRPHQKRIDAAALPQAELKAGLIGAAVDAFGDAGYAAIGMDHFAKPDDELAVAAHERRLHRNFMGYTTHPAPDMLAAGVSAIGDVSGAYTQNTKKLSRYYAALDAGRFPIERGYALLPDDHVRRHVIMELMCNFRLERAPACELFDVDFDSYFARELEELQAPGGPVDDGLLVISPEALEVTSRGRIFVRNICMAFDAYLAGPSQQSAFSRTI
jgi:oxygen-independent coproporphyrinogen-3 oxidase